MGCFYKFKVKQCREILMYQNILIFMLLIILAGCGGSDSPSPRVEKTLASVQVNNAGLVEVSQSLALTATASYNDGSTSDVSQQAAWTSTAPGFATVDPVSGIVTGLVVGTTTVTATYQGVTSDPVTINVIEPPILTALSINSGGNLDIGEILMLSATATYSNSSSANVTRISSWSSSNPEFATVDPNTGVVTGVAPGTTMITASYNGLISPAVTIDVITLDNISITNAGSVNVGNTIGLGAIATYTDGISNDVTQQVLWTSSNPEFAAIGVDGVVTGVAVGTSMVTAVYQGKISLPVSIIVTPASILVSIIDASIVEGNSGTSTLTFTISLDSPAPNGVSVDYSTADGTAIADTLTSVGDYTAIAATTLIIPANSTSATIDVLVNGDADVEQSETFTVTLSNPVGIELSSNIVATGTILDDDSIITLNDTGVTSCSNGNFLPLTTCPQSNVLGQDAEYGRDATQNDDSDGHAGFSFTQIAADGTSINPVSSDYLVVPWSCVTDNVTGLMWEVKTTGSGLQDESHRYTWYNSTGINDGGTAGVENGNSGIDTGACVDTVNCDTEKYVAQVNAVALCGFTNWRLPELEELISITDLSLSSVIDNRYFPNIASTLIKKYWTSTQNARDAAGISAFVVDFNTGERVAAQKREGFSIRLVRSAN